MDFLKSSDNGHFYEHHNWYYAKEQVTIEQLLVIPNPIHFSNDPNKICVRISNDLKVETNYYVGVDWLNEHKAIYVQPKLNRDAPQTDYLQMLFTALKNPDVANYTKDLFEIKWDKPYIKIEQQQDLLTPLLIVQFLSITKEIVRKGLKKSYYKVEQNLNSRVKGKVLVGQTIKKNFVNNKPLKTYCSFDEFGLNGLENRVLKKALVFVQRYLPTFKHIQADEYSQRMFNYILPAFENVSAEVDLNDVKHTKTNAFYKEYAEAIRLAKLILKRFGYNISNTANTTVTTPPFWIDMSKLFELYILGLLRKEYGNKITFQDNGNYGYTDFLLNNGAEKIIIDAKYKPKYNEEYLIEDIRQLSGYARDKGVLEKLGIKEEQWLKTVPNCLIIYPERNNINNEATTKIDLENKSEIKAFVNFYKLSVSLPQIK